MGVLYRFAVEMLRSDVFCQCAVEFCVGDGAVFLWYSGVGFRVHE